MEGLFKARYGEADLVQGDHPLKFGPVHGPPGRCREPNLACGAPDLLHKKGEYLQGKGPFGFEVQEAVSFPPATDLQHGLVKEGDAKAGKH